MYIKQKYKFDCWVSALINFLKDKNIDIDYLKLIKTLKTTWFWWTKPEKILEFMDFNKLTYNESFNIHKPNLILVDQIKFYNDWESPDYGHYVYYTWKVKNWLLEIFDPWDWEFIYKSKDFILNSSLDVLVWKTRRYSSFFIN